MVEEAEVEEGAATDMLKELTTIGKEREGYRKARGKSPSDRDTEHINIGIPVCSVAKILC